MTTITIAQKNFRAVAPAMAKADIRYYLQGMLIEHNGIETRLVATDGHRCHAVIIEHEGCTLIDPINVIIPHAFITTICKAKAPRHNKYPEITLTIDGNRIAALLPDGTETICTAVDGTFPDYQRIIPDNFSGEVSAHSFYKPDYIADAIEGVETFLECKKGCSGIGFMPNGNGVGGLSVPGFVAVVAGLRADMNKSVDTRFKSYLQKPEAEKVA